MFTPHEGMDIHVGKHDASTSGNHYRWNLQFVHNAISNWVPLTHWNTTNVSKLLGKKPAMKHDRTTSLLGDAFQPICELCIERPCMAKIQSISYCVMQHAQYSATLYKHRHKHLTTYTLSHHFHYRAKFLATLGRIDYNAYWCGRIVSTSKPYWVIKMHFSW